MKLKFIGWVAVYACVVSVFVAVNGSRETYPQSAQAFVSGDIQWPGQPSLACKTVTKQLASIRSTIWTQQHNGHLTALEAMDQLVSRESMIDTSRCPADFRLAEARLVVAENTLSLDAHINSARNSDIVSQAIFAQRFSAPLESASAASDGFIRDLQAMQSAIAGFDQSAAIYAAK